MNKLLLTALLLLLLIQGTLAQPAAPYRTDVQPSPFDYGRMWAFEYAPLDYFQKTYGFRPDEQWLEKTRLSALRFADYCSASFISPDGLILTNHHCSRGEVGKVMKEGEDFDKNGFYAVTADEERQVPDLYVKQLVRIADITDQVREKIKNAASDKEMVSQRDEAIQAAIEKYSAMQGWEGLEIEPVDYYNGGRFSLYGYKKYDDVRLVLIPELALGFFGGDPDNFTYPRYSLDFTIWRVYEDGKPVNSSNFYFPVNVDGVKEGEPVFVIGNPGSTGRYRTVAQLEHARDYSEKIQLTWMRNRMALMEEEFKKTGDRELQEMIFNFSNSVKSINGQLEGMADPYFMGKKLAMETKIRSAAQTTGANYWTKLDSIYKSLRNEEAERVLLNPNDFSGNALLVAVLFEAYRSRLERKMPEEQLQPLREQIRAGAESLDDPKEEVYLATLLGELKQFRDPDDKYVDEILDGQSPQQAAERILSKTKVDREKKVNKWLEADAGKLAKEDDPILEMGRLMLPELRMAIQKFQAAQPTIDALSGKVANEVFKVYGLAIPPDATFTLRLADGVVKSYEYNGTLAPVKTTYFGMYDRFFSHDKQYPWALPERWQQPAMDLLRSPLNFVSTNDIIGGNSGSPIINRNRQVVGLVFDGNMESLPGDFIFDETANRAISVHAGGLAAALKYIYKADRILKELGI